MPAFLIALFVILILVFRKKPAKKTRTLNPSRPVPPAFKPPAPAVKPPAPAVMANRAPIAFPEVRKVTPPPVQAVQPPARPNVVVMDLAKRHFGWEWQEFLLTKPSRISQPLALLQTTMAWAYQKLDEEELRDLLYSLINTSTTLDVSAGSFAPRRPYIYTALHEAVYELATSGKFEISPVKLALKKIIVNYRVETAEKKAEVIPPPVTSVPTPADPTIIDVEPGDHRLNYIADTVAAATAPVVAYPDYDPDDYKLGKLYKDKLKLSPQEAAWLNKFLFYGNTFNSTEGCKIALMRLYLQVIKKMVRRFANAPVTLTMHLEEIKTAAYETSLRDNSSWYNYDHKQAKHAAEADLYYTVFKKCEAALRIAWRAGRSSAPSFHSRSDVALKIYQQHIEPVLDSVVTEQVALVASPDEEVILALNVHSTTRWKLDFEAILKNKSSIETTKEQVYELLRLNGANPAIENIYYEAAKVFAPLDKTEALRFYLRYVEADQRSARIDNKDFQKTTLKQLFSEPAQEQEFRAIISELIRTKDLRIALEKTTSFYQPKRKKITLDNSAIERAAVQLQDTVEVLNVYLTEEEEVLNAPVTVIAEKTYTGPLTLNTVQQELLAMFEQAGLTLDAAAVADFARSKGLFKNQLIDGINDSCYEIIDDVLIEEDGDQYQILPDYYKQLTHP